MASAAPNRQRRGAVRPGCRDGLLDHRGSAKYDV